MPGSRKVIAAAVIDTTCLRCLLHLDLLPTLVLRYNAVYIPRHVWQEASRKGRGRYQLRKWLKQYTFLKKCSVADEVGARLLYDRNLNPGAPIHRGEAEVIVQAREREASEILIDELAGREIAQRHGLKVKGVLGLLKEFKLNGIIPEVRPLIEKLRRDLSFWIDENLLDRELKEVGER